MENPQAQSAPKGKRGLGRKLFFDHAREYLGFDSVLFRKAVALSGTLAGLILLACRRRRKGLSILAALHRGNFSALANKIVEAVFRRMDPVGSRGMRPAGSDVYQEHIDTFASSPETARFFADPYRLLGSRLLVLKSPGPKEKGVIVLDYSFIFPLFAKLFDVASIGEHYHIVLEPSWSGYCEFNILCYSRFDFPIFVQSIEPRDSRLLQNVSSNLLPVPVAANWWVDHRIMRPASNVPKDVDVIMIASWSRFKRHARFFAALAKLRAQRKRLQTVLVGYAGDCTMDDIYQQAKYYGVEDQVEMYERLKPEAVNGYLNRAKVNIIWSRREGVNRTIIEGMFCDVPCIVREGFNYGFHYPHINSQTGCYSSERALPDRLVWMTENYLSFSPREWVMANMTCQRATDVLAEAIRQHAVAAGENWTRGLAVKVCYLNAMRYWDEADTVRFKGDYEFVKSLIRPVHSASKA